MHSERSNQVKLNDKIVVRNVFFENTKVKPDVIQTLVEPLNQQTTLEGLRDKWTELRYKNQELHLFQRMELAIETDRVQSEEVLNPSNPITCDLYVRVMDTSRVTLGVATSTSRFDEAHITATASVNNVLGRAEKLNFSLTQGSDEEDNISVCSYDPV